MSLEELKKLWNEFEDVPIDEDEYIDEDFYIWGKGTDRYHIWHWFDDRLPNGLAKDLMGLFLLRPYLLRKSPSHFQFLLSQKESQVFA